MPAIRASLAVTVHDLTEDVMPGNFAGNFGLRGLAKWAAAVGDRRSAKGWSRLFDSGPAFGHAMRRLHDCLTFEYSSPGAMRPLYADFLTGAAEVVGDAALRDAADRYAAAGAVWAQIADTAAWPAAWPPTGCWWNAGSSCSSAAAARRRWSPSPARWRSSPPRSTSPRPTGRPSWTRVAELAARVVPLEEEACAALREAAG